MFSSIGVTAMNEMDGLIMGVVAEIAALEGQLRGLREGKKETGKS